MQTPLFDWDSIDTVLLDMDGTLLDLHFDNFFWQHFLPEHYAHYHKVSTHQAKSTLQSLIAEREGTMQWYCLDHWSDLVGLDIPKLKLELKHKIAIRPHSIEFLKALQAAKKHIVLITNSHPKGLEIKLDVTKIDQHLDMIISSHQFNFPKEEQAFWHALQDHTPFENARTLFVDDTPRILESAKHYGIKHLLCITEPDSQKPRKSDEGFKSVAHFDELLPLSSR